MELQFLGFTAWSLVTASTMMPLNRQLDGLQN